MMTVDKWCDEPGSASGQDIELWSRSCLHGANQMNRPVWSGSDRGRPVRPHVAAGNRGKDDQRVGGSL